MRPASPADVEAVAELRAVVLRADLERLGRYDGHRVRQRLREGFEPSYTWVIEVGGAFAGCVALRPAEDAHWLEHFYLAPHLQGSGIGSGVLRGLLEWCDRDGVPVRLNVLQGSPARRLYERYGFTPETEDPVDVFMMRKPAPRSRSRSAADRVADDDVSAQQDVLGGTGRTAPERQPHGGAAQLLVRDVHGGQVDVRGRGEVVESDQRDVVGDAQPALAQRVAHTGGDEIVGGEDGGEVP